MESVRFETYLRLIWIQICTFFKYFSRRLFAKHHTSSSLCRIFSGRSRSSKSRLFFFCLFVCLCSLFIVVIVILILLQTAFWHISILTNHWWKFYSDRTRIKSKNIGTFSKLTVLKHLNSLNLFRNIIIPDIILFVLKTYSAVVCSNVCP